MALSNPNGNDGQFLDFGDGFAFAAAGGVTVAAFVRHDSFQSYGTILSLVDGGGSNIIILSNYGTTRRAQWYIKNGEVANFQTPAYDGNASLAFFPPAGAWAHVAAVASPDGVMKLYRDGATQGNWTQDDGVAPNPSAVNYRCVALGRSNWASGTGYYFDGALRDVRLYARALGGDEIAAIAAD